jgi:hypothetical protein
MATIRQSLDAPRVKDIATTVQGQIDCLDLAAKIQPGDTMAITAGSRGIASIGPILAATVESVRSAGAVPFIVPAMGCHG